MFFGEINYIFLYAILPALITVFILSRKKVNKALSIFIKNFNFKNDKNYKRISNLRISSIIFLILAIGFLIFSLMQPKWGIIEKKIKTESYMITILLDLSKSMDANDIYPSRLGRAKLEIEDFIKSVDNLSVALVGFAGTSFIATPFTQDMETFTHILDNLNPKLKLLSLICFNYNTQYLVCQEKFLRVCKYRYLYRLKERINFRSLSHLIFIL